MLFMLFIPLMLAQMVSTVVAAILLFVILVNLLRGYSSGWGNTKCSKRLCKLPPKQMVILRPRDNCTDRCHVGRNLSQHSTVYLEQGCRKRRIPTEVIKITSQTSLDGCKRRRLFDDDEEISPPEYYQDCRRYNHSRRRRHHEKDNLELKYSSECTVPLCLTPKVSQCALTSCQDNVFPSLNRYASGCQPPGCPPMMAHQSCHKCVPAEYPSLWYDPRFRYEDPKTCGTSGLCSSVNPACSPHVLESDGSCISFNSAMCPDCTSIPYCHQARCDPYDQDLAQYNVFDETTPFAPKDSLNNYYLQVGPSKNGYASSYHKSRSPSTSNYDASFSQQCSSYRNDTFHCRENNFIKSSHDAKNKFNLIVRDKIRPEHSSAGIGKVSPPMHGKVLCNSAHIVDNKYQHLNFGATSSSRYRQCLNNPYNKRNVSVDHISFPFNNRNLPTTRSLPSHLKPPCFRGCLSYQFKQKPPYDFKHCLPESYLDDELNLKRIETKTNLEQNRAVALRLDALRDTSNLGSSTCRDSKLHPHCKPNKRYPPVKRKLSRFMLNSSESQTPTILSTILENSLLSNNVVPSTSKKHFMGGQLNTSSQKKLPPIGFNFSMSTSSPKDTTEIEYHDLVQMTTPNNALRSEPPMPSAAEGLLKKTSRIRSSNLFSRIFKSCAPSTDELTAVTRQATSPSRNESTTISREKPIPTVNLKPPDTNTRSREHAIDNIEENEPDNIVESHIDK